MKTKLSIAIRNSLIGLTGAVGGLAGPTFAQDGAQPLEEVQITGSRIRGTELVGSTVMVMDRQAMQDSGGVTIDRMLKEIPQNFDLGVSDNSRGQSGGAGNIVYSNSVNLRGIGAYATLILVDGHRAISNSRSVDPSMLPTLGVERIEVIADGSSAIYGSDAIAGVVNIIQRRSLDGAEAYARYGSSEDGAYTEESVGFAWGRQWDGGQVMLAYDHIDRSRLNGDDRDFFTSDLRAFGGRDYRINRCSPGTLITGSGANAVTYAIPQGGLTQANVASLAPGTQNLCDLAPGQDLSPAQRYNNFNSTGSYNFSDTLTFSYDGFYSKREFARSPGVFSTNLTVPSTNAFFVRPTGFTGNSYTVAYSGLGEFSSDSSRGYAENWQISPAFSLALPADWELSGVFSYGKNKDNSKSFNGVHTADLNAALASNDPATAFDPYGLGRTSRTTLDRVFDSWFIAPTQADFKGYELRTNGNLFSLPAGDVAIAAGIERQELDVRLGTRIGVPELVPMTWRAFDRRVNSYYTEVVLPLADSSSALGKLDFTAAARYDDYSDVGSTTNTKLGISWQATDDLKLRASHGTSFRAPIIPDIYGNSNAIRVGRINDPTVGGLVDFASRTGPNLGLEPEEATSWSIGADWNVTNSLTANLTYFDVDYRGKVENATGNPGVLSLEASYAGTPIIQRGAQAVATLQALMQEPGVGMLGTFPGGNVNNIGVFIDSRNFNLGVSRTKGFDLQLIYLMDIGQYGALRFNMNGMFITEYDVALSKVATPISLRNIMFNPLKWRTRGNITWDYGNWHSQLSMTYVNSYRNNLVVPNQTVSSYTPVDLRVAYDFGDSSSSEWMQNLQVSLEARNLFDEDPPFVDIAPGNSGSGGYDATIGNPIGRLFAVALRKSF
jgi:iron complex outermembrane recepter protein